MSYLNQHWSTTINKIFTATISILDAINDVFISIFNWTHIASRSNQFGCNRARSQSSVSSFWKALGKSSTNGRPVVQIERYLVGHPVKQFNNYYINWGPDVLIWLNSKFDWYSFPNFITSVGSVINLPHGGAKWLQLPPGAGLLSILCAWST